MPFTRVNPGDLIQAQNLNQVLGSLNGTAGQGVPITQTSVNDASNYALSVQNLEATNSRALNVVKSDGSLLIRADATGVSLGAPLNPTAGSIQGTALANATVTNAKLASDVARANLLTNGGFEVWQRGAGAFSANGAYTADRWQISLGGSDTVNVARGSGASPGNYYLSMTVTHVAGGFAALKQDLKNSDGNQFKGKTLTFSADVASTTNMAILILAMDGTGAVNVNSPNHPGNSQWTRLSVTAPIPSDNTNVAVHLWATGSGTVMIDNAMLVVGSTPADYVPLHPADDLARCLRYYETTAGIDTYWGNGSGLTTTNTDIIYVNQARKAIQPTLTTLLSQPTQMNIRNVGTAVAVTAVSTSQPGMSKTFLNCSVAGGLTQGSAVTAYGGSVILEANP